MVSAAKSVPDRTDFHHQAQLEIELGSWPMTPGSLSPGLQTDRPNIRPQGPSWPRRKLFHTSRCCAKYRVSLLVSYDALQCGFPGGTGGQESACLRDAKRFEFDPWLGKIPWGRKWQPTQYSCLGNSTGRGAWRATVHGATESRTRLSD